MKPSEKIYWIKASLAIVTGVVCFYLNSALGYQGEVALVFGLSLYLMYSEALAMYFKVDRNRSLKISMGAFLFLWMLSWTLLNTLGIGFNWFP